MWWYQYAGGFVGLRCTSIPNPAWEECARTGSDLQTRYYDLSDSQKNKLRGRGDVPIHVLASEWRRDGGDADKDLQITARTKEEAQEQSRCLNRNSACLSPIRLSVRGKKNQGRKGKLEKAGKI